MEPVDYKRRTGAAKPPEREGGGRGLRLGVCLLLLAAAFCLKTFAPDTAEEVGAWVMDHVERETDYQAVFSAVGGLISGERNWGETVAVIRALGGEAGEEPPAAEPVEPPAKAETAEPEPLPANGAFEESGAAQAALRTLVYLRQEAENRAAEPVFAAEEEAPELPVESTPALPDNAAKEADLPAFAYVSPVEGAVSDRFGWRVHPLTGEWSFHYGLDLAAAEGTPILAFADGEVLVSGESTTAGKYLILRHGDGWLSQYFHCSALYVSGGDAVALGEKIAAVGQTGAATGPHLHFELLRNGLYLDPEAVLEE